MSRPFLFEWIDVPWLPDSLRRSLHDILDITLAHPLRGYYSGVIREIRNRLDREQITLVCEMGAGRAPIAERLAPAVSSGSNLRIQISDLYPDREQFRALQNQYPHIVQAITDPVALKNPPAVQPGLLLVLSGCFHHLSPEVRAVLLKKLARYHVLVSEPIGWHVKSLILDFLILLPALASPLVNRPGRMRRMFWTWVLPLAPAMMLWDSVVSSVRCWTEREWLENLQTAGVSPRDVRITEAEGFYVSW
jgi:hypothetical protein